MGHSFDMLTFDFLLKPPQPITGLFFFLFKCFFCEFGTGRQRMSWTIIVKSNNKLQHWRKNNPIRG